MGKLGLRPLPQGTGVAAWLMQHRGEGRRAGVVAVIAALALVAVTGTAICMVDAIRHLGPSLRAGNDGRDCCGCRPHSRLDSVSQHLRFK
jgi:hypothetical protein